MEKHKTRTRHDFFYFLVSTRYFVNYNNILKGSISKDFLDSAILWKEELRNSDINSVSDEKVKELADKYNLNEFASNLFGIRIYANIIIVFSAMCLESLINDYCVINKSATYFKKHIDRLDTPTKWLIVPKLITNKEISTDSQAFQMIKELFTLRNNLVHPKSREFETDNEDIKDFEKEFSDLLTKGVQSSYRTIKEATKALYQVDPSFKYLEDYKWLWDKDGKFNNITEVYSFYSSFFSISDKNIK